MFYCAHCNSIYDPIAFAEMINGSRNLNGMILCPVKGCENQIVDIDENFIPLIHMLYKFGIKTTNCCSGHSWDIKDNNITAYFTYDYEYDNDYGFVTEFTKQLQLLSEEEKYSFIRVEFLKEPEGHIQQYNDIEGWPQETSTMVGVYIDSPKINAEDYLETNNYISLLHRQIEVMNAINETINRTIKALKTEISEEIGEDISEEEIIQDLLQN